MDVLQRVNQLPFDLIQRVIFFKVDAVDNGADRFYSRLSSLSSYLGPATKQEHIAAMLDHVLFRDRWMAVRVMCHRVAGKCGRTTFDFVPMLSKRCLKVEIWSPDKGRVVVVKPATSVRHAITLLSSTPEEPSEVFFMDNPLLPSNPNHPPHKTLTWRELG